MGKLPAIMVEMDIETVFGLIWSLALTLLEDEVEEGGKNVAIRTAAQLILATNKAGIPLPARVVDVCKEAGLILEIRIPPQ